MWSTLWAKKKMKQGALRSGIFAGVATLYMAVPWIQNTRNVSIGSHTHKEFLFRPFFSSVSPKSFMRLFLSLGKCLMTVAAAGMHINFTRILVKGKPEILNHKNLEVTSAAVGKNKILLEYHNAWSDKSVELDSYPGRQFNWIDIFIHRFLSLLKKKSTALKV